MQFLLTLSFVVSLISQATGIGDLQERYDSYRRAGLTAFLKFDYRMAEYNFQHALDEARRFGLSDARLAMALNDLAQTYGKSGRLVAAESLMKQSASILKNHDPEHYLSIVLNNLGRLYVAEEKMKEAERTFKIALLVATHDRGPADPYVSDVLSNLSLLQARHKKYKEAEALLERSLEMRQASLGPDTLKVADALNDLGVVYLLEGQYPKSEEMFLRSLRISEKLLPAAHPDLAAVQENMGVAENKLHRYQASETWFLRSVAMTTKAAVIDRPELLAVYADTLKNLNRKEEAAALLDRMKRLLAERRFVITAKR